VTVLNASGNQLIERPTILLNLLAQALPYLSGLQLSMSSRN